MNRQMMEGLVGAGTNIRLADVSMSVYRQASSEGDTEKMKRALAYTGECTETAVKYQEKLDKGMKTEAKEEREKAKLEREEAIEERRDERRKAEGEAEAEPVRETDLVSISEEGRAEWESRAAGTEISADGDPVAYTEARTSVPMSEPEPVVSFFA